MNNEIFQDYISKGVALMSAENYVSAKEAFVSALQEAPRSIEAYMHIGNACANLSQFDESLEAFKKALLIDANSGEALFSIANIYLLKDEKNKAVEYYNKAEKTGYRTSELYQILAGLFYEAGDIVQTLRNISKAISVEPLDGELRLFKARVYLAEGKFHEALETLDDMQRVLPDAFEVYDLKAQIYSGLNKCEEAIKVCDSGIARFPADPNMYLVKLNILVKMEKDDEALSLISKMKNSGLFDLVLKEASIQESVIYIRKNEINNALSILNKANEMLEDDADIAFVIMDLYGKTEQYEKLIEISKKLIDLKPGDFYEANARYFHAHSLNQVGKIEEAKKEFKFLTSYLRKLTIKTPSFYEGYIFRLLSHTKLGEYDKALDLADYLENIQPERADSHMFRYFIYKEQGDKEKAASEKKLALEMEPNLNL